MWNYSYEEERCSREQFFSVAGRAITAIKPSPSMYQNYRLALVYLDCKTVRHVSKILPFSYHTISYTKDL